MEQQRPGQDTFLDGKPPVAEPALPGPLARDPFLRAMLDASTQVIYVKDTQGRYLFVNRQYEKLSGVPRDFILGKVDEDLFPPDVAALFREQDRTVLTRGEPMEFEESVPLPSGVYSFITGKYPLRDGDGPIYAVGGFCTDITSRKSVEEETLAAERERLAVTLRCVAEAIVSTDTQGRVATLNPAAEELLGLPQAQAVGRALRDLLASTPGAAEGICSLVEQALLHARPQRAPDDVTLPGRTGAIAVSASAAPVRDRTGKLIGVVLSLRDVTQERRASAELLRAENLQSIGMLAGGIAHDFNNFLAVVLANATHLRARLLDSPDQEVADDVIATCDQARGLARQLLTFARGGDPVRRPVDFGRLVESSVRLVLSGSNLAATTDIPADLWAVNGDEAQLVQVVTNLLINAREAMPQGGTLQVRVCNAEVLQGTRELPAGGYLRLQVRDHGPGMPAGVLTHIFDPYFSTKGRESGLGLAVVYSAVKRHGGHISVELPRDGGCLFTVMLPTAQELPSAPGVTDGATPSLAARGRVLVMDDEDMVRRMLHRILVQQGHEVDCVQDGAAAVERYRQALRDGRPYGCVVLDLTVRGGMGGRRASEEIRALDAGARLIVSSGYSDETLGWATREQGIGAVVEKPYTAERILAAVDGLLRQM